ncbi:hypothetical protein LCGC14_1225560 [marine sediment metagenome]|uniref:Uncharacterized protein n=1 Tax=marine sediment metagenome TaxID=412755 RepID=A0A0F9PEF1_9ZZZZ|nr:hypothetical protein [Pricia sp.]
MRGIILVLTAVLFLLSPVIADNKESKYEPMDVADVAQWYTIEVIQSIIEDAQRKQYIATLGLTQDLPCFEIEISTEPIQSWDPFWEPEWAINGENCVDKRTYNCEDE